MTPYDKLLARQRRHARTYRANKRAARAPDAKDVGAALFARYLERRAADEGSDDALVQVLAKRGFDRTAAAAMLTAAVERAKAERMA